MSIRITIYGVKQFHIFFGASKPLFKGFFGGPFACLIIFVPNKKIQYQSSQSLDRIIGLPTFLRDEKLNPGSLFVDFFFGMRFFP